MNKEFFLALEELEKKQGISMTVMLKKTEEALVRACQKEFGGRDAAGVYSEPVIEVISDIDKREIKTYLIKTVVAVVDDPVKQISLEAAREHNKRTSVGKTIKIEIKTQNLHRISAKAARDVIIQGIREAEKENARREFENKEEEIITATVKRLSRDTDGFELDTDKGILVLPADEIIPGEQLCVGQKVKIYFRKINRRDGNSDVRISRKDAGLIRCMFKLEIPEVDSGEVVIKNIAREAGSRTKVSVYSTNEEIDAVGSCIGPKGMRIQHILDEIAGEKIDIVAYSEDTCEYVKAALAPATVESAELIEERSTRIIVKPEQLSLAIGRDGQNARLAAKLTGCKVDIKTE